MPISRGLRERCAALRGENLLDFGATYPTERPCNAGHPAFLHPQIDGFLATGIEFLRTTADRTSK
jgi:hypothetical protein